MLVMCIFFMVDGCLVGCFGLVIWLPVGGLIDCYIVGLLGAFGIVVLLPDWVLWDCCIVTVGGLRGDSSIFCVF